MAKISVVVPAHNEEEELPVCLSALGRQDIGDFELIVVDSASTDSTAEVAREYGAHVVRVDTPGVARARQAGFTAASGEIVVSTDADAVPPPDWLSRLTAPFSDSGVVGTFGTLELRDGPRRLALMSWLFTLFQQINFRLARPLFCGPNFAVRKKAFQAVSGFSGRSGFPAEAEDVILAMKLRREGRIVFLPELAMPVSARRLRGMAGLRYVAHHAGVYLRVCWLGGWHG